MPASRPARPSSPLLSSRAGSPASSPARGSPGDGEQVDELARADPVVDLDRLVLDAGEDARPAADRDERERHEHDDQRPEH